MSPIQKNFKAGESVMMKLQNRRIGWKLGALTAALLLAISVPVHAQSDSDLLKPKQGFNKGGRTSFQFLKIGVGARQAALGEANIALVRDVNSAFWDPAGLAGVGNLEVGFNYTKWLGNMNYMAGAVGYRWGTVGLIGVSIASLNYGDIPEALVTSTGATKDTRTGNTFTGGDLMAGLSYTREFTDRLAIGITAKYVHESLWNYSAGTYAFDVGTNYNLGFKGMRLAMSAQNFAGAVDYLGKQSDTTEGYDVPLVFRVGMSAAMIGQNGVLDMGPSQNLEIAVEAINSNDYGERIHVGAEYSFDDLLWIRGGYRFNYEEGNMSFGFGLTPRLGKIQARFDYAYVQYKYLDTPHRLTLTLAF